MRYLQYDEQLWFMHEGCEGKHFLIGNPHTFKGRMWAWCPIKQRTFFVSPPEMVEQSVEAKYWVDGFLHGNEPDPPKNSEGNTEFDSESYRNWQRQCEAFRSKGFWADLTEAEDQAVNDHQTEP